MEQFQSQGRFFGGCCYPYRLPVEGIAIVSIAGAILWGVLPRLLKYQHSGHPCFNRRGDSLGGAA